MAADDVLVVRRWQHGAAVKCEICGNDKRSRRQCCRDEISRLRSKNSHLHNLLDKMEAERDKYANRIIRATSKHLDEMKDPWQEQQQ